MTITNTDFAVLQSFQLSVARLPDVSFFSTSATLPGVRLNSVDQDSIYKNIPRAGTKLDLDPFVIDFYVDKNFNNYLSAMNWILALGRTDDALYQALLASNPVQATLGEGLVDESDGSLLIYTANNNPALEVIYHGLIPTILSSPRAVSDAGDVVYLKSTLSFTYTYFEIKQLGGA